MRQFVLANCAGIEEIPMATLEEVGADARTADGYVVVWSLDAHYDAVLAVPMAPPKAWSFAKLRRVLSSIHECAASIQGLRVDPRTVGMKKVPTVFEISFVVPKNSDHVIRIFLECAAQSSTIRNPIVSDMRNYAWK